jgi:hypothetical protein
VSQILPLIYKQLFSVLRDSDGRERQSLAGKKKEKDEAAISGSSVVPSIHHLMWQSALQAHLI